MSALIPLESLLDKPARAGSQSRSIAREAGGGAWPGVLADAEEAAETEELREYIEQDFPAFRAKFRKEWTGRNLLKVMAASLAMAGAAACTKQPKS